MNGKAEQLTNEAKENISFGNYILFYTKYHFLLGLV